MQENIIAKILQISNQNFNVTKIPIINNSIQAILDNIEPLLQNIDKMQNVYRILDNIFRKASSSDEIKEDKSLLRKIQLFLDVLAWLQ